MEKNSQEVLDRHIGTVPDYNCFVCLKYLESIMTDKPPSKVVCLSCKASMAHPTALTDEYMMRSGWEEIGGFWYCDECAPYRRKQR